MIKLTIKLLTGKSYEIELENLNTTVPDLKHQLAELTNIPSEMIRLAFAGRNLLNYANRIPRTLGDYGVYDGATIHLMQRMRLGPHPPRTLRNNIKRTTQERKRNLNNYYTTTSRNNRSGNNGNNRSGNNGNSRSST
jgi:hypothetical protein